MIDYLGIAVRISVLYIYALAITRLAGKRSIGNMTPLDFIVGLMIGDLFDDVIFAQEPVAKGLVGLTTIVLLHVLVAFASYKSARVDAWVSSTPTAIVRAGQLIAAGLRRERTTPGEVAMELRLAQVERLKEVQSASWEPSGQLSIQLIPAAKPAQKRDLPQLPKAA